MAPRLSASGAPGINGASSLVILLFNLLTFAFMVRGQAGDDSPIEFTIIEELPADTLIGNIAQKARLDEKYNPKTFNKLRFSFLSQPNDDIAYFRIQENTGIIQTARKIDRDSVCPNRARCVLSLDVAVSPREYFQVLTVNVEITDDNDNAPAFPQREITHHISESSAPGTAFSLPSAEDRDSRNYSIQTYELLPATQREFDLRVRQIMDGSTDLQLVLLTPLDRETQDFYQLEVIAKDGGQPPKSGSIVIKINVDDTNDNHPHFANDYEVDVSEDTQAGTTIETVVAHDADIGLNGEIRYSFTAHTVSNYGDVFGIETTSGAIYLKHPLDYEKTNIYPLVVTATDSGPDSQPAQATVIVRVMDVNDSPPQITVNTLTDSGEAQISENSKIGTFVAHVSVKDLDSGPNGALTCSLNSDKFHLEKLHKSQYTIVTGDEFDRELQDVYDLQLTCSDGGEQPLTTVEDLRVVVQDANDHVPMFSQSVYHAEVDENNFFGAFVVGTSAIDKDIGPNGRILYKIEDEEIAKMFHLEEHSGVIRAGIEFDHETINSIAFPVIAYDQGTPSLTATTTVSVTVNDVNDSPPVFSKPTYSFGTYENKPEGTEVGHVMANDADSPPFNVVEYSLDADDLYAIESFNIDKNSGQIVTTKPLDREVHHVYYLRVKAINPGYMGYEPFSSTASVTVHVADVNDNKPVMEFPTPYNNTVRISSYSKVDHMVTRILAHDEDIGGSSQLEYSITEGNDEKLFQVDSQTGAVTIAGKLSHIEHKEFNLTAVVTDKGKPPHSISNMLHIIVTNTIPPPSLAGRGGSTSEHFAIFTSNSTIVIGVACGSLIIIIVLVCAIIIIKCQDRRPKPSGTYNCRVEAQKMLNTSLDSKDRGSVASDGSHDINIQQRGPTIKKGYNNSLNNTSHMDHVDLERGGSHTVGGQGGSLGRQSPHGGGQGQASHQPRSRQNWPDGSLTRSHGQGSPSKIRRSHSNRSHDSAVISPSGSHSNRTWHNDKEMEVHKVLEYLRSQDDTASVADSGRGASVNADDADINAALTSGNYVSFSNDLNEREILNQPETIAVETKNPGNHSNGLIYTTPKLKTFAPLKDEQGQYIPLQNFSKKQTPHPSRNRLVNTSKTIPEDPCGPHGNSPVNGGSSVSNKLGLPNHGGGNYPDSGYHGNSDSDQSETVVSASVDQVNNFNNKHGGGGGSPGYIMHQDDLVARLSEPGLKDSVV